MLMHVFLQIPGRVQYNTAALSLRFNKEILNCLKSYYNTNLIIIFQ